MNRQHVAPSSFVGRTTGYRARHASDHSTEKLRVRLSRLIATGTGKSVAQTATANLVLSVTSALNAAIVARAAGPSVRGEYSAVTAWFGVGLLIAELGQPVAVCFYAARDPHQAPSYVATARAVSLALALVVAPAGFMLAPLLSHGSPGLTLAYRVAFTAVVISSVGDCYTFALMGRKLDVWNKIRVVQPLIALSAIVVLWRLRMLTIDLMLLAFAGSLLVQFACSYWWCRQVGLAPGKVVRPLVRRLTTYGAAQVATLTPAAINTSLDQIILSVAVTPASLGYYSMAVAITMLPAPLVSAIGLVLLPKLAARGSGATTKRLRWNAVMLSVGLASAVILPIALLAPWLVPAVLGAAYRKAVPLVWILAPGGIFLSCSQVVTNLLRGLDRSLAAARAEGIGVVFTILLLAVLVPTLGVTGAAIASTVPYGITLTLMLRHLMSIPEEKGKRN